MSQEHRTTRQQANGLIVIFHLLISSLMEADSTSVTAVQTQETTKVTLAVIIGCISFPIHPAVSSLDLDLVPFDLMKGRAAPVATRQSVMVAGVCAGKLWRRRTVVQAPQGDGRPCAPQMEQWKPCLVKPCYSWRYSSWSQCKSEV